MGGRQRLAAIADYEAAGMCVASIVSICPSSSRGTLKLMLTSHGESPDRTGGGSGSDFGAEGV